MKKFLLFAVFLFSFSFTHNASASASASLLISSATVASDGVTVTVNISGVNTTLSCTASPCTGFSVTLVKTNSFIDYITNVAVSGSVATLTLSTPVLSGNTVKVSLASGASSNLTDSGNNTPSAAAGNTNATVTNSSAQIGVTAGISSSTLYLVGDLAGQGGVGNPVSGDPNSHIDFSCSSCTNVGISQYTSGSHLTVSIDGGAFNSVTPPSGAALHQWFSLASGLTNTSHTFSIKNITFVHTGDTIMVSSSTGATLNSISTLGRQYYLSSTSSHPVYADKYLDYGVLDGGPANNGENRKQWRGGTDGAIRFNSSCQAFSIYAYQANSAYKVYRDGVVFGSVYQAPATTDYNMLPVATGSDGAMHLWEIVVARPPSGSLPTIVSLMPIGCSGSSFGTKPSTLPLITFNGDSTIDGNGGAFLPTNNFLGRDSFLVARALGLTSQNIGHSGKKVSEMNGFDDFNTVNPLINSSTPVIQAPKYALLSEGTNDSNTGTSLSQYQTDWLSWITKAASYMATGGFILVRGTYPTTVSNSIPTDYNNVEKTVVNTWNAGSPAIPAYYVDTTNWWDSSVFQNLSTDLNNPTYDTGDGLHGTSKGFAKFANREIPIFNGLINGSSYTITNPGSLSGTAGTASGSFTVTLPGSATFTGDQTITLSDGGNGGTFTPSVGSAGVSPVTVTPTNGLTSFTFTYNPASAGTKTISFTHGQNNGQDVWVDPSSVSYVVTSVPSTPVAPTASITSATSLTVTLTPPATNGSAITGYTVTTYISGVSQGTGFDSNSGSSSTSHLMTGLTTGTPYTFTFTATNGVGTSSASPASNSVTPADIVIPTPTPVITQVGGQGRPALPSYVGVPTPPVPSQGSTSSSTTTTSGSSSSSNSGSIKAYNFGTTTLSTVIGTKKTNPVKELQRFLNDTYNAKLPITGVFGTETKAVVKKWQKDHGLTADGVVGAKTKVVMRGSTKH